MGVRFYVVGKVNAVADVYGVDAKDLQIVLHYEEKGWETHPLFEDFRMKNPKDDRYEVIFHLVSFLGAHDAYCANSFGLGKLFPETTKVLRSFDLDPYVGETKDRAIMGALLKAQGSRISSGIDSVHWG